MTITPVHFLLRIVIFRDPLIFKNKDNLSVFKYLLEVKGYYFY